MRIRFILLGMLLFVLSGCNTGKNTQVKEPEIQPHEVQMDMTQLFDIEEEEEDDDELYFHDSKDKMYKVSSGAYGEDKLRESVELTLEKLLKSAKKKLGRRSRNEKINITLEIDSESYKDELLNICEEYILSIRLYKLHAQSADAQKVVSKIIKKELDPFYQTDGKISSAQASDMIVYIKTKEGATQLKVKASVLNKASDVLATRSQKIDLASDSDTRVKWIKLKVPHTNGRNTSSFSVMFRPVSEKEFLGRGSAYKPMTNISIEAANNFCSAKFNGALLSTPYIFEYARRIGINKPHAPAVMEMISPVDYEDMDELFYVEGDKLESEDEDVSTMIIFRWTAQRYNAISSSFKSHEMAFRCYR